MKNPLRSRTTILFGCFVFLLAVHSYGGDLVVSVPGKELFKQMFGVEFTNKGVNKWGAVYTHILENKKWGDTVIIGVFASTNHAYSLFRDRVFRTSVGPNTECTIGDHVASWSDRRIAFVRDNVFVEIQSSDDNIRQQALAIDIALRDGKMGIKRGSYLRIPVIKGVDCQGRSWKAIVDPDFPGYTSFVDEAGHKAGIVNQVFKIAFVTGDCVMAEPLRCDWREIYEKEKAFNARMAEMHADSPEARKKREVAAVAILRDKTSSFDLRSKAVVVLGNSADASVIPLLIEELQAANVDPVVKQNTIAALGKLRAKQAAPILLEVLREPVTGDMSDEGEYEAIYRDGAARALGKIGDPAALPVLKSVAEAEHEYPRVRDAAAAAIREIESVSEGASAP